DWLLPGHRVQEVHELLQNEADIDADRHLESYRTTDQPILEPFLVLRQQIASYFTQFLEDIAAAGASLDQEGEQWAEAGAEPEGGIDLKLIQDTNSSELKRLRDGASLPFVVYGEYLLIGTHT